jgi:hypothetical protein
VRRLQPFYGGLDCIHLFLRLEPEVDQAADGFGAGGGVGLTGCPSINIRNEFVGKADGPRWVFPSCGATGAGSFTAYRIFGYCLFHRQVLPYSGLKNKRPTFQQSTATIVFLRGV